MKACVATDEYEISGLKLKNVGPPFSSLTVLLRRKSLLWFVNILESEMMRFLLFRGHSVDQ